MCTGQPRRDDEVRHGRYHHRHRLFPVRSPRSSVRVSLVLQSCIAMTDSSVCASCLARIGVTRRSVACAAAPALLKVGVCSSRPLSEGVLAPKMCSHLTMAESAARFHGLVFQVSPLFSAPTPVFHSMPVILLQFTTCN